MGNMYWLYMETECCANQGFKSLSQPAFWRWHSSRFDDGRGAGRLTTLTVQRAQAWP
jgi:hypothetical protein